MKRLLLGLIIAFLSVSQHALADRRVALVIGNAEYSRVGALENPVRDASAMADTLRALGFEVIEGANLDRQGMQGTLRQFLNALDGADVGLFYYAGHGVQVDGENHLIPVDAQIEGAADLDIASVPLSLIRKKMSDAVRVKLIILDACRDNPFANAASGTRAIGAASGLAPVQLSDDVGGAFVAFATDPGAYAQDGLGKEHSPFTKALLDNLVKPGMELHAMMIDVRADVWNATHEQQRPWSNSSLTGKFYFSAAPKLSSGTDVDLDLALWEAASIGDTAAEYQAYLDSFPNGAFAGIARSRLARSDAEAAPLIAEAITDTPDNLPTSHSSGRRRADQNAEVGREHPNPKTPQDIEAALGLTLDDRMALQRALTLLGLEIGEPDGIFGEQTRTAIRSWQWSEEFPASGYFSERQIALIYQHAPLSQSANLDINTKPTARAIRQKQRHQTLGRPTSSKTAAAQSRTTPPAPEQQPTLLAKAWHEIGLNLQSAIDGPATDPLLQQQIQRQRRHNAEQ